MFGVNVFGGWPNTSGVLGSFHLPLEGSLVRNSAVANAIPHCDAVCENAFSSAMVKVQQDVGGQVSFP